MGIVNFYSVLPEDLKPGDVLVCAVTLQVTRQALDGPLLYRMYRCNYPKMYGMADEVPQGTRIFGDVKTVGESLFPGMVEITDRVF